MNSGMTVPASALNRRELLQLCAAAAAGVVLPNAPAAAQRHKYGAIDCHAHWHPEAYLRAMKELGRPIETDPKHVDLKLRLAYMAQQGIDVHILTILTPGVHLVAPADGARLAQLINDAAVEAHAAYPTRFFAGAALPIQDPALALAELNRIAGKPGICAIHLPTSNEAQDFLFKPDFAPIFARAEQLGYPLIFHPIGTVAGAARLEGPAFITNTVGFPFEHTITAARFIVDGVLDKYPRLQILLPHAGGAFPYVAGRIEYGLMKKKIKMPQPFQSYVRRFHYDTIAYSPETLRFLIRRVGSDRVVIGSDNYAFMDIERPTAPVEQIALQKRDRERIFTGNAVRLFRL